jgi:acyl carrier protein
LVEEEFGIDISMDDLVNLLSFEMILDFVEGGNGVS